MIDKLIKDINTIVNWKQFLKKDTDKIKNEDRPQQIFNKIYFKHIKCMIKLNISFLFAGE